MCGPSKIYIILFRPPSDFSWTSPNCIIPYCYRSQTTTNFPVNRWACLKNLNTNIFLAFKLLKATFLLHTTLTYLIFPIFSLISFNSFLIFTQ